jgi:hypothetical protein
VRPERQKELRETIPNVQIVVILGAGGVFEITEVVPGDYYAVAFDRPNDREADWSSLLNTIIPIASSVRVESGSAASVDLRVNRWPW